MPCLVLNSIIRLPFKTAYQKRTEEDKGDEVNISEYAATCFWFIYHSIVAACTGCACQHNQLPVFTCCGPMEGKHDKLASQTNKMKTYRGPHITP